MIPEKLLLTEGNVLLILGIDTSGRIASCAVCDEDRVISQSTIYTELTHSQVILPVCQKVLEDAGVSLQDIDGIAVANGPGSYTGLRIGISAVKAMCFALDKKCAGISTLESLAYNMVGSKGTILAVMRARADLLYTAAFKSDGRSLTRLWEDMIISESALAEKIAEIKDVILVGDAAKELSEMEEYPVFNEAILAPTHNRLQLASSLCYVAMNNGFTTPDTLDAAYLQITKAEKDREK